MMPVLWVHCAGCCRKTTYSIYDWHWRDGHQCVLTFHLCHHIGMCMMLQRRERCWESVWMWHGMRVPCGWNRYKPSGHGSMRRGVLNVFKIRGFEHVTYEMPFMDSQGYLRVSHCITCWLNAPTKCCRPGGMIWGRLLWTYPMSFK